MNTMQQSMLDAIEARLADDDYTMVIHKDYGNIGKIGAIAPGNVGPERLAHFDFQSGYVTFKRVGLRGHVPADASLASGDLPNVDMLAAIDAVVEYLK